MTTTTKSYWREARRERRVALERDPSIVQHTLALVMEKPPSLVTVLAWDIDKRVLAWEWAFRTHLRASDNPVRWMARPSFVVPGR